MLAPFIASLSDVLNISIDKINLSKRRIPQREYIPFLFLYLFVFSLLATPFLGAANWDALAEPQFLFLFLVLIIVAITWNIFYYDSLRKEELFEFETILMLVPIATIVMSYLFFPEQWNTKVGITAIVAGLALVWSHWDRHHLRLDHYALNLIVAVVLMAVESIVAAELLRDQIFSPISLYAVRTGILAAFFFLYYRPRLGRMRTGNLGLISLSAFFGALMMVSQYYGFVTVGIVYTVLIVIAAPMGVYLASAFVLKERMRVKVLIAAAIIAACIVYATALIQK